ncbi:MAG: hypothetical protein WBV31_16655 [Terriglobales bacterium]|jgi:outer membrane protein assembly factor BamD (BamD/ComL family)
MSVSGISSSSFYDTQNVQSSFQQFQQTFQQLGKDLQSGNLTAAQSDFATLQKLQPQNSSTSSAQSNSPIAEAFNQLSKDLQAGNLSGARQDYTAIQQAFQSQAAQTQAAHGHHHHHSGGGSGESEISQLMDQLGTALQSGDLTTAQTTFAAMQQQIKQNVGETSSSLSSSSSSSSNSVSVHV